MSSVRLDPLPWSWTRLSLAQRCSYAFFLETTSLIPSDQKGWKRKETEIGLALHRLARLLLERQGEVTITFGDDWIVPPSIFLSLQDFVVKELPKLKAMVGPDTELLPELQIRLDEKLEPDFGWPNGFIVGSLDLSLYSPTTKTCLIIDYKTGDLDEASLVSYYRPQLELYALLFHRGYAPIERIGLLLRAGRSSESFWLTDQFEDFSLKSSIAHLQGHIAKAHENLRVIQPTKNGLCRYCSVRSRCPIYEGDD